jgi:REP-associated tyrosine transposase
MSHSFNKIWIHAIWATKNRQPLIRPDKEKIIHEFLRKELIDCGCRVRIINGMPDHVHLLFLLNREKSIAGVIKQVKGCSSHSVNEQNLLPEKFAWQTGYAAFSVSESQLEKVYHYIANQKARHRKQSFLQEYEEFIALHDTTENA